MANQGCGRLSSKVVDSADFRVAPADARATLGVSVSIGTSSTAIVTPATLEVRPMMGRFSAAFVCVVSLDYLYDADGMALRDSDNRTLITE